MAAFLVFLFIITLAPPNLQASPVATTTSIPIVEPTYVVHNFSAELWMQRACAGIRDPQTCVSSLRGRAPSQQRKSPASIVNAAIRNTLKEARSAIDAITKFTALSFSYREQLAVEDCKELLDFSVTELAWSLAEMNRVRAGTGLPSSEGGNLKAWLSAALSNQDTCLEGFEGTDRHVEKFIRGSLKQVTQLIGNVLSLYTELHGLPFRSPVSPHSSAEFPDWMTESDRKAVKGNPVDLRIDAVVALDGSGHFRSIADAVDRAPPHSNSRYVILVVMNDDALVPSLS